MSQIPVVSWVYPSCQLARGEVHSIRQSVTGLRQRGGQPIVVVCMPVATIVTTICHLKIVLMHSFSFNFWNQHFRSHRLFCFFFSNFGIYFQIFVQIHNLCHNLSYNKCNRLNPCELHILICLSFLYFIFSNPGWKLVLTLVFSQKKKMLEVEFNELWKSRINVDVKIKERLHWLESHSKSNQKILEQYGGLTFDLPMV